MFSFPRKNRSSQEKKSSASYAHPVKAKGYPVKIPVHFQRNPIVTYSAVEINQELKKYPGLLKTLGHAYQYEIIFTDSEHNNKEYWFCRNLQVTMPLLKYLNQQGWQVDWQEKPFSL